MADEVVGSAYVIIRALTERIRDDIRDGVKKGATANKSELEKAGDTIGETVGEAAGEKAGVKTSEGMRKRLRDDKGKFRTSGNAAGDHIASGITNSRGIKSIGKRIADIFRRDQRGSGGGFAYGKKIAGAIGKGIGAVPLLPFILTLLVPALGGTLKIISAYVGAATSLLASLGPVVAGSAVAGISAYLALGTAVGAVTLALKAESAELDNFKESLAGIGERFQSIGRDIQKVLFKPLAKSLNTIADNLLPKLRKGLVQTGVVIADLSGVLANLTSSKIFQNSFGQVLENNNRLLRAMGTGLIGLFGALVIVLSAARPVIDVFGRFIRRLGLFAAESAAAGKRSGALAKFFDRAAESMRQWGRILGNFGRGLGNILKIAAPFGQILTDRIQKLSRRFREFTESTDGKNKIALFFQNSLPIVRAFNRLLGAAFKLLFGGLAKPDAAKGTVKFLNKLRKELLPALGEMAGALSGLGPGLTDLTVAFAGLITAMANSGGLGAFVDTLKVIFDGISKVFSAPLVGQAAGFALGMLGIAKAFDLILKPLGGIAGLLRPLGALFDAAFGPFFKAIKLIAAANVLGGAGPIAAFVSALSSVLGPVLIVVGAIALIIGAIVLLYKKNEAFRDLVQKAWGQIKDAVQVFFDFFTQTVWPELQAIFGLLQQAWIDLSSGTGGALGIIQTLVGNAVGAIVSIFSIGWDLIAGIVEGTWTIISSMIKGGLEVIKGVINLVMGIIKGDWSQAWLGIRQIVKGAWTILWGIVRGSLKTLWTIFKAGWKLIGTALKFAWQTFVNTIKGKKDLIIAAVKAIPGLLRNIGPLFKSAGKWLIDKFVEGMKNAAGIVSGIAGNVWDTVRRLLNGAIDKINSALQFTINLPGPDVTINPTDIPNLAKGGVVRSRRGGTIVRAGEAGSDEAIVPLNKYGGLFDTGKLASAIVQALRDAGFKNGDVNVEVNSATGDGEEISMKVVNRLVAAGAF